MAQQRGMKRAEKVLQRKQKKQKLNSIKVARRAELGHGHDHGHDHDHDHDHDHEHEHKEKKAKKEKKK